MSDSKQCKELEEEVKLLRQQNSELRRMHLSTEWHALELRAQRAETTIKKMELALSQFKQNQEEGRTDG